MKRGFGVLVAFAVWGLVWPLASCSSLREVGPGDGGPGDADADADTDADADSDGDGDGGPGIDFETPDPTGVVVVTLEPPAAGYCEPTGNPVSTAVGGDELGLLYTETWEGDGGAVASEVLYAAMVTTSGVLVDQVALDAYPADNDSWQRNLLAFTGDRFVAVVNDARDGESEVYSQAFSTGLALDEEIPLTAADTPVEGAAAAWLGDVIGVAFRQAGDIRFLWADPDLGAVAGSDLVLTSFGSADVPVVAGGAGALGIAYSDGREGQRDVFFSVVGTDGDGAPLPSQGAKVAATAAESTNPVVAWTGSEFAVLWFDRSGGDGEDVSVHFARVDATGMPVPSSPGVIFPAGDEPGVGALGYAATYYLPCTLLWTGTELVAVLIREAANGWRHDNDLLLVRLGDAGTFEAATVVATGLRNGHNREGTDIWSAVATVLQGGKEIGVFWGFSDSDASDDCDRSHWTIRYDRVALD